MATVLLGQEKEVTVPFTNPADEKSLDIRLVGGEISIVGTDRTDILIQYEVSKRGEDEHSSPTNEKSRGMKRIGGANFEFEIEELKNKVRIKSNNVMNMISLKIEVPRKINIDVSKQIGSEISIANIEGIINVENNIGDVTIANIRGSVNASSSTGEVTISFDEVDPEQSMIFNTISGNIDITFPPSYQADLKMRTEWGEIYSDMEIETEIRQKNETKKNGKKGSTKILSNTWTYGALNGGGPEITLKTQLGSLYLRAKE